MDMKDTGKRCSDCGLDKTYDQFRMYSRADGTKSPRSQCLECENERSRERYARMTNTQRMAKRERRPSVKKLMKTPVTKLWPAVIR
jgi:hypothetical protein